ncbi:glutaredoxin-like protein NrdH [Enterococcus sp. AN402]|uniref:glutaredoxin-like protein NrdH n=1 Tax=Enterococcus sp. AN402 TaxID=3151386 RepID=UPI003458FD3D
MDLTVYSKPDCMACKQTKRLLERYGISFTEVNILEYPTLLEQFKEVGFLSAPIVVTPDNKWCGFRPDKIKSLAHNSFLTSTIRDVKNASH